MVDEIKYEIRYDIPNKGKGLVAKQFLQKDCIIFTEKPFVSCQFAWNKEYKYKACDYCMKPLETAEENARRLTNNDNLILPYSDLCNIKPQDHINCVHCRTMYCCISCKEDAYLQYHKLICPQISNPNSTLNSLLEIWKQSHYPPESFNVLLLAKIICSIRQSENPKEMLATYLNFIHEKSDNQQKIVHKLLGKQFKDLQSRILEHLHEAFYGDDLKEIFTENFIQTLLCLVGRNGQGIGTSSLSLWSKRIENLKLDTKSQNEIEKFLDDLYSKIDDVSGDFLDCEGSGLFLLQSYCNHNCRPNAEIQFPFGNFNLQLVALRDIQPGEEIEISYLDDCQLEEKTDQRQKILLDNYLFNCHCQRCQDKDDPSDEDDDYESNNCDMES